MSYPGLSSRVEAVRERIAAACLRAGRRPEEVTIVAVTKTHLVDAVRAVVAAGLRDVGENRVQELEAKVELAGRDAARWHLIGHLQRNKAKRAVELADVVHSVDSVRIAQKLSEEAEAAGRRLEVLIQVNVSGEATKGGLEGEGVLDGIAEISTLAGLRVRGLMTMAPFTDDTEVVRRVFVDARKLLERAAELPGFDAEHLSMGMSGDFEIAVEEGSTLVRLGTVLLGERGE